jgi:predicted DNA-binding antitoxin AbrB/MazE fold protein
MTFTVAAVYESGVLRLAKPLPLAEHEQVTVTVRAGKTWGEQTAGVIPCTDPQLIEWAAMDPELDYPPPPEEP